MKRHINNTEYLSNIYANYPAKKSEYKLLYVVPDMGEPYEEWDDQEWYNSVKVNLAWLIKELRELSEIRSVRPGKIVPNEAGGYVEIPILLNTSSVPLSLWESIEEVAYDNCFLVDSI